MTPITLCLVKNFRKNVRCDKCDILLNLRTWKNQKIALSINGNKHRGFLCVKCVSNPKVGRFHRTKEQLNEFVRKI